jgi:hypothetical protein
MLVNLNHHCLHLLFRLTHFSFDFVHSLLHFAALVINDFHALILVFHHFFDFIEALISCVLLPQARRLKVVLRRLVSDRQNWDHTIALVLQSACHAHSFNLRIWC